MEKEFCSYKIALKLKELSFDEECLAYYRDRKISGVNKWNRNDWEFHSLNLKDITCVTNEIVLAPLWQQVIDWFREKHNIHINPMPKQETADYSNEITGYYLGEITHTSGKMLYAGDDNYESFYIAREQGILKAIKAIKI